MWKEAYTETQEESKRAFTESRSSTDRQMYREYSQTALKDSKQYILPATINPGTNANDRANKSGV